MLHRAAIATAVLALPLLATTVAAAAGDGSAVGSASGTEAGPLTLDTAPAWASITSTLEITRSPSAGASATDADRGSGVTGVAAGAPLAPVGGVARAAGPGTEAVIGDDNRVAVAATTAWPYRATAYIQFSDRGATFRCTGFLVGPSAVATSGHCIHEGGTGRAQGFSTLSSFRIRPAATDAGAPFGECGASAVHTTVGWVRDGSPRFDYGVITLSCDVGLRTGWYGLQVNEGDVTGATAIVRGYPADKKFGMWQDRGAIRKAVPKLVKYRIDTAGGESGAAVLVQQPQGDAERCDGPCAFGVHGYGDVRNNFGPRITQDVFDNLVAWGAGAPPA